MKPFAKAFGKEPLYFDGAMGTMLQREGLQSARRRRHGICCALSASKESTALI